MYRFARKHWRGEYSLTRSFWLNLILISLLFPLIVQITQSTTAGRVPTRVAAANGLVATALQIVCPIWGAVGTIRSGARYSAGGGSKVWFHLTGVLCVLLMLDTAWFAIYSRTALLENVHMAFTGKYGPPASIAIINDGTALRITGELEEGTATAVMEAIDSSPGVTSVVLDSKGGMFGEARRIAGLIADHRLNTYVQHQCSSACTLAFLAGATRCMSPSARIGFHAGREMGSTLKMRRQQANAQGELYARAGLPDSFIDGMMATASTSIWYPTYDELVGARVLTPDCTSQDEGQNR
jgi:hypothetical protein